MRVLADALFRHLHQYRQFLLQLGFLLCKRRRIAKGLSDEPRIGDDLLSLRHQSIERRDKCFLDFILRHMGHLAFLPVILVVAAVDSALVLIRGMPNLSSKVAAALAASDFPRENAHAAVSPAFSCASLHLPLHHLEHGRVDDGRMALFHEVAWHLPAVLDGFLGEEVRREGLLNPRTARVFLVGEDSPDGLGVPFLLARDRQNMPCGQLFGNSAGRKPFKEKLEDEPHDFRLRLVDGEIAVLALVVAEKARVAYGELAVGELFPKPPCDVLGDGAGFLLRQAAEDGQEDFRLTPNFDTI